ncbi:hypothetical protein DK419_04850 [Methylobacterium terrae]|uniref:Uncharacterized protein n=1 Tax=Methylobacterium terrae TaxID=2202827 RepID=A0A2U8WHU1_9HYPH|nr:hypothetical protein [Methylobacterium terrae]AWN45727.1 hypothetical protein DK419_04850 [Methylobacterium terrae]
MAEGKRTTMRGRGDYSGRPRRTRPFGARYLFQPRRMSESQYLARLRAILGEGNVRIVETPSGRTLSIRDGRRMTPAVADEYQWNLRDLVAGLRDLLTRSGDACARQTDLSCEAPSASRARADASACDHR